MKADLEKAAHWQQHLEAIKSSGLTRKAYCEKNGLKVTTLDYWYRRLNPSQNENREDKKAAWIPLHVSDDRGSGIDLRLGKIAITVKPGFDAELLTDQQSGTSHPFPNSANRE
jgi:hypothetical protein